MWPVLLNMTRDDCRRTLRRLELEAYSNMISVFRAQGPLEDGRRKLLEDLRGALHIGGDRHSAEARRAANDELLATIAEQLSGPNTGLAWISEGRRRVPLMPRGIPQTAYTELADKVALQAAAENEEIARRLEAERLVAPRSAEGAGAGAGGAEGATAEGALPAGADLADETLYPPIVMEDQSMKLLEMEVFGRKRKLPESGALPEDVAAAHALANTPRVTNQKHLNLSQIYSNYSKPPSGKSSSQSKHSYNQVSKVSSKPIQSHTARSSSKRRKQNPAERSDRPKSSSKSHAKAAKLSNQQTPLSSKSYNVNPMTMQLDFSQPPPTFQASYAQSILSVGLKNYGDEMKTQPNILTESPTMRLLTQPATVPHELGVVQPDDPSGLQAQSTPIKSMSGKACQFVIKKKDTLNLENPPSPQKLHMSEIKILKKPAQNIKVLQKKPIIVPPGVTHKELNATGKLLPTKFISNFPSKAPAGLNSPNSDKIVTVSSGSQQVQKSLANTKNIILTSSAVATSISRAPITVESSNTAIKAEGAIPKGSIVNDVKMSTKTFVINPKSGQKMVVLPAKARGKADGQTMPLLHFKSGISTTMKLVPVSSSVSQLTKTSNITIVSKASLTNTIATTNSKALGIEGIKSTITHDASSTPKVTALPVATKLTKTPIVRQSTTKGNLIVVQKGTPLGKTIAFAKNGSEMSKIVMSKNVNKLIQAQSQEQQSDSSKNPGFILLDLNDQDGTTTTMSKILDSHSAKIIQSEEANKANLQVITEDTPVLFDTQLAEETCNANSMDSLSTGDLTHMEEGTISSIEKEDEIKSADNKESESAKDTSSSVTDWEMELDTTVGRKRKAEDGGSLHLDMCMSSDSETDAYLVKTEKPKSKPSPREGHREGATEESSGLYGDRGVLSRASRTLLSQLQDEGSSSNDSSFTLNKAKLGHEKAHDGPKPASGKTEDNKGDRKQDSPPKTQTKRMDMFSAADINLDSFAYLEEGIDDMFHVEGKAGRSATHAPNLDEQLSRLLGENAASDANSVGETLPINK